MSNEFLLKLHLEAMVPLKIQDYQTQGGPQDYHIEQAQKPYSAEILSQDDAILYPNEHTAKALAALVNKLAILAFSPGGVTAFGLHFEAKLQSED